MATITGPRFRALSPEESRALLGRLRVGRIAFTLSDRVDIEPINYVMDGNWIFGRTSDGTKLATLLHHPWCAFEVDEERQLFEWSSVVVKGIFHLLDPEIGSPDTYQRALRLLRSLVPGTFEQHDPAPHRDILFGIYIDQMSGRSSQR